ncbi:ZN574 protein, partial [Zosterops hypoxanthus]|nr:ZN574 protein [Zosterops hypoxanthus]
AQSSTLRQHLQHLHLRRFPHLCPDCGLRFHRPHRLLLHRAHHTGEYPYKCPQCGLTFLLRRLLEVHLLSHRGGRAQVCQACGAAFPGEE